VSGWAVFSFSAAIALERFHDVQILYIGLSGFVFLVYPVTSLFVVGTGASWGEDSLDPKRVRVVIFKTLLVLTVAAVAFAVLQMATQSTIIELSNRHNVSKFVDADMLGTFRPPSFFVSSLDFGLLCLLCFALSLAYISRSRIGGCIGLVVSLAGIVMSQTRNIYLSASFVVLSFLALRHWRSKATRGWFATILPLVWAAVALSILVMVGVKGFNGEGLGSADMYDLNSTWARVSNWLTAIKWLFGPASLLDKLFGIGIVQAGQASDYGSLYPARSRDLFIDNTSMSLLLYQGLIGLFLFWTCAYVFWRMLLKRVLHSNDWFSLGIASFAAVYISCGMFNILSYGTWAGMELFCVLVCVRLKMASDHQPEAVFAS